MSRVIVHHAYHPDDGEGVYRLVHAEQDEITVSETVEGEVTRQVVTQINPDFVAGPAEGEPDERTDEQKEMLIEQEVEIPGEPQVVERTETFTYDYREVIWDGSDERWEGMSDEQIAEAQREDVRNSIAQIEEGVAEAKRKADSVRDLGAGIEL